METSASELDVVRQEQDQADVLEDQPRLNLLMCIGIVVCLSGALWLGIYTAVVALLR